MNRAHRNWSSLRKILEEDRLCPALRGRVQYFVTTYNIFHHEFDRFAVRVDKQEWLHGGILEVWKHAPERSRGFRMDDSGVYCTGEFREAANIFVSDLSIDEALVHENPIIRMLAVLDRRIGKRRLPEIAAALDDQPEWLRRFYRLRLDAEGYHPKGGAHE